jgi:hypothetical protein
MSNRKSGLVLALAVFAALPLYATHALANDHDEEFSSSSSDNDSSFIHRMKVIVGKYGWTTQQVCVNTAPQPIGVEGVDPATFALKVPAQVVGMAGVGTATFHANGTMTIDVGSTADNLVYGALSPGQTPLTNGFTPVCSGTYSIGAQNRTEIDWNCDIGTANPAVVISGGPVNMDGWVADDGNTIDVNLKGTLQTLMIKQNGTPVQQLNRLCIQRFVFHKIPAK